MIEFEAGDRVRVPGHSENTVALGYDEDSREGRVLWVGWAEEDEVSCDAYPLAKVELVAQATYLTDIEIAALMTMIDDWHGQDEHAKTSEGFRAVKMLQALFERIAKRHPEGGS